MDEGDERFWELFDEKRRRKLMKLSWPGVVALLIAVAGAVTAGVFGQRELALCLAGLATGLVANVGAIRTSVSALPLVFAVGLAGIGLSGCAGSQATARDARIARTDFVLAGVEQGLLQAGEALVPFYQRAEERCADLGVELAYQRCIQRWDLAIDAMSSAYYTVRATRDGLGATSGDVLPCVAGAVSEAIRAVNALGIDLPEIVQTGLDLAQGMAAGLGGECGDGS